MYTFGMPLASKISPEFLKSKDEISNSATLADRASLNIILSLSPLYYCPEGDVIWPK